MNVSGAPTGSHPDNRTERILTDMLTFADEIDAYVISLGEQNFHDHRQTQLVAEALLHRIGEAVSRLDADFIAINPEVEWLKMKRMRNVVAHEYGFIDYRIVWRALTDALPRDVAEIRRILGRREEPFNSS
ncbi:HepT-like ribonuclease domain-containing protein [Solicola gregarius]|uniref:DUF86 domain-containing protein n=1 Tax=Solicola gregarius TaxID=2908642 RepID=A0AA46TEJ2_9ACTN|nr:HepT-like ribonuclease domain-containing protein [Solicola gregarius]UYM03775.1 DUF86 domain-containing protein [Solicola gregarius]